MDKAVVTLLARSSLIVKSISFVPSRADLSRVFSLLVLRSSIIPVELLVVLRMEGLIIPRRLLTSIYIIRRGRPIARNGGRRPAAVSLALGPVSRIC